MSLPHLPPHTYHRYTSHEIYNLGGRYSHPKLLQKAQQFCAQPWRVLQEKLEAKEFGDTDSDRLQNQCFKSAWIMTVLHEGFGLPKEKVESVEDRFQSVDSISGFSVSWTLGVALMHAVERIGASGLQSTPSTTHLDFPASSSSSSSFAGEFFLLFILLAVVICMGSRWLLSRSAGWKGSSSSSSSGVQYWLHQRNSYHPLSRLGSGGVAGSQGSGIDVELGGLRSSGGSNGHLPSNGGGPFRNPFPTSNNSSGSGTNTPGRSSQYGSGGPSGYSSSYVAPKYPLTSSVSLGVGGVGGGSGGPMKLMRE